MTEAEIRKLAAACSALLQPHLARSPALRELVDLVGRWLCHEAALAAPAAAEDAATAQPQAGAAGPPEQSPPARITAAGPPTGSGERGAFAPMAADMAPVMSARVPLRLGDAQVELPVPGTPPEIDRARQSAAPAAPASALPTTPFAAAGEAGRLELLVQRCALKAQAARLVIERRRDEERRQALRPEVDRLLSAARELPDCFLWMFFPDHDPPDDERLRIIGDCYDALAEAARLMQRLPPGSGRADQLRVMQLMAEACSALRVATGWTWLTRDDHDQAAAHGWLREQAYIQGLFIPRFMSIDDPADPLEADSLRRRITQLASEFDQRSGRERELQEGLKAVRYHVRRVAREEDAGHDWRKLDELCERLAGLGVSADDRRLSELLSPVANQVEPPGLSARLQAALAAARRPPSDGPEPGGEIEPELSATVHQARSLLRGGRIVLIGGEPRADVIARLRGGLNLAEVDWVPLVEHGPGTPMRAPIRRADTVLVAVILKLTGHLHAEEARDYANEVNKPCVLLPAGYGVEQIARAVVEQASERLSSNGNALRDQD